MSQAKYRLSFTEQEINYLHQLVCTDPSSATKDLQDRLHRYFKLMKTKLEIGAVSAAFTSSPKKSLEEKLGMLDPVEAREAAYLKWQTNPALCTEEEVQKAKTHMYENGLFTESEEEEFEAEMFKEPTLKTP